MRSTHRAGILRVRARFCRFLDRSSKGCAFAERRARHLPPHTRQGHPSGLVPRRRTHLLSAGCFHVGRSALWVMDLGGVSRPPEPVLDCSGTAGARSFLPAARIGPLASICPTERSAIFTRTSRQWQVLSRHRRSLAASVVRVEQLRPWHSNCPAPHAVALRGSRAHSRVVNRWGTVRRRVMTSNCCVPGGPGSRLAVASVGNLVAAGQAAAWPYVSVRTPTHISATRRPVATCPSWTCVRAASPSGWLGEVRSCMSWRWRHRRH